MLGEQGGNNRWGTCKYSGDEEKKEQHFIDTSINITELELTKKAKKTTKTMLIHFQNEL